VGSTIIPVLISRTARSALVASLFLYDTPHRAAAADDATITVRIIQLDGKQGDPLACHAGKRLQRFRRE